MAMFDTPDQLAGAILTQRMEDIDERLVALGAEVVVDASRLTTLRQEQQELIAERDELGRHPLVAAHLTRTP